MIFIVTALQCEAAPLIKAYRLKKLNNSLKWNTYGDSGNLLLIVTGTGPISAAAAVSALLEKFECTASDILVNIGSCCELSVSATKPGKMYLINKLTDGVTGRDYYPDMLHGSSFAEHAIVSLAKPVVRAEVVDNRESMLYDMEAAFIYQAARYYLGPSHIIFLKVVSDNGISQAEAAEAHPDFTELARRIEEYIGARTDNIRTLLYSVADKYSDTERLKEYADRAELFEALKCSQTMENTLNQLLKYADISQIDYRPMLAALYQTGKLPVKCKKDGLAIIQELKALILQV